MKSNGLNFTKAGLTALGSLLLLVVAGTTGSRGKLETTVAAASRSGQLDFATPEAAGNALQSAARSDDENALAQILGPDWKAILSSGDAEEDKASLASFVAKYDRMNRWVAMSDGSRILYIGADNFPYPIPLLQDAPSQWYFDAAAGKDEVLARRIGKNELLAIDAISAMAKAEEVYYKHRRDDDGHRYAQKILSTPGTQDGLYWEVAEDQRASPLGRLNEFAQDVVASTKPGSEPVFDGYTFRILTAQGDYAKDGAKSYLTDGKMTGGFAILASPVTYGNSGIMTFMVGLDGVVYQRDLGKDTADLAAYIFNYNPDGGWTLAE